jgi:hypothetical protein
MICCGGLHDNIPKNSRTPKYRAIGKARRLSKRRKESQLLTPPTPTRAGSPTLGPLKNELYLDVRHPPPTENEYFVDRGAIPYLYCIKHHEAELSLFSLV